MVSLAPDSSSTGLHLRPRQQQRGGDIGAIGKADRDRPVDAVSFTRGLDKVGQFGGTSFEIVEVELARPEPTEKARHAVFQYLAARRQERAAGRQSLAERDEIVLVAAGAVQQQQGRQARRAGADETVDEAEVWHKGRWLA